MEVRMAQGPNACKAFPLIGAALVQERLQRVRPMAGALRVRHVLAGQGAPHRSRQGLRAVGGEIVPPRGRSVLLQNVGRQTAKMRLELIQRSPDEGLWIDLVLTAEEDRAVVRVD